MDNKNFYICIMCGFGESIEAIEQKAEMRYRIRCTESLEADTSCRTAVEKMLLNHDCREFTDSDTGSIPVLAKEMTFINGRETLTAVLLATDSGYYWHEVTTRTA